MKENDQRDVLTFSAHLLDSVGLMNILQCGMLDMYIFSTLVPTNMSMGDLSKITMSTDATHKTENSCCLPHPSEKYRSTFFALHLFPLVRSHRMCLLVPSHFLLAN